MSLAEREGGALGRFDLKTQVQEDQTAGTRCGLPLR